MTSIGDFICTSRILGRGAFAPVYYGYHVHTQVPVAIKQVNVGELVRKDANGARRLANEVRIMKMLNHDHVVRLYDVRVSPDRNTLYMALELCDMGDLENFLKRQPQHRISEQQAQQFIRQIASGLFSLRAINVVHRDLKPANILLCSQPSGEPILKIADFGFARETNASALLESYVGTPLYMAPEILQTQRYNVTTDLWSVGVILYQMVCGSVPFVAATIPELVSKLRRNPAPVIPQNLRLSYLCQSLLSSLLTYDPSRRCTWQQFFNHPWVSSQSSPFGVPEDPFDRTPKQPIPELPPRPAPAPMPAPAPAPSPEDPAPELKPADPDQQPSPNRAAELAANLEDIERNINVLITYTLTISDAADTLAKSGEEAHALTLYIKALEQLRSLWNNTGQMLAALNATATPAIEQLSEQIREHCYLIYDKILRWKQLEVEPAGSVYAILFGFSLSLGKEAAKKESAQDYEHSLHTYTFAINIFSILLEDATAKDDRAVLSQLIEQFAARKAEVRSKLAA